MNRLLLSVSERGIRIALLAISTLILIICLTMLFQLQKQPKIAFVKSEEIVYGYVGMKEAHEKFQKKVEQWEANQKVLEKDFQTALLNYEKLANTFSADEKRKEESDMMAMQQNLERYANNIGDLIKQEDVKMTQGVLTQINSFIRDYALEHGYDLILGTTDSGNLLYGNQGLDITDVLLKELNDHYLAN